MKKKFETIALCAIFLLVLFSCAGNPKAWKQDLSEKKGKSAKKDSMIIFTGSDWDERSKLAFEKLFTPEFFDKFSKDFVLYNIDVVRDSKLLPAEVLSKNYLYFSEYGVDNLPYIVLETPDGDAYAAAEFGVECGDMNQFSQLLEKLLKKRDAVVKARTQINITGGSEKTLAIDNFFNIIKNSDSNKYDALREIALKSDPNNKTGLKAKYLMINVDLRASKLVGEKKFREASNEFVKTAQMPELSAEEKQLSYYYGAYILAMQEGVATEEIRNLLQKSLDAAPQSKFSVDVKEAMKNLKNK